MTYMKIYASATIEVLDHKSLLTAWRTYGGPATLVGSFTVRKALTAAQFIRLPAELRAALTEAQLIRLPAKSRARVK